MAKMNIDGTKEYLPHLEVGGIGNIEISHSQSTYIMNTDYQKYLPVAPNNFVNNIEPETATDLI